MPAGVEGIIKKIRETVGDLPVYLSIDVRIEPSYSMRRLLTLPVMKIDSIDPAFAPATGTPETGGKLTFVLSSLCRS